MQYLELKLESPGTDPSFVSSLCRTLQRNLRSTLGAWESQDYGQAISAFLFYGNTF